MYYTSATNLSLINFDGSSQSFQYGQRLAVSKKANSCVKLSLYTSDEDGNSETLVQERIIDFDDPSEYWGLDSGTFDSRKLDCGSYVLHKCVGTSVEDVIRADVSSESFDQTKIEYSKSKFDIVARVINDKIFIIAPSSLVYNGKSQHPTFSISNNEDLINPSSDDYTLEYYKDYEKIDFLVDVGDYVAKLNFKNNFLGTIEVPFSISAYQIDDSYDNIKLNYDKESGVTFDTDKSDGSNVSTDDFKVSYEKDGKVVDSINEPGNYTAVLTFFGNYSGQKRIDFNVPEPQLLTESSVELNAESSIESSVESSAESNEKFGEESTEESSESGILNLQSDSKSQWGRKEIRHDIAHYISDDGLLSVEIDKNDKIWLCEKENNTDECWYCLDNTNGTFEIGSRFSIKWLSKGDPEYDSEIEKLDESKKQYINLDKSKIFLVSVTDPDGNEYSTFDKVDFYLQISGNWTKESVRALFLNSSDDEIVEAYFETVTSPSGPIECARLVLTHFSPYLLVCQTSEESYSDESYTSGDPSTSSSTDQTSEGQSEKNQASGDKTTNSTGSSSISSGHPFKYVILCSILCSVLAYYFIFRRRFNIKQTQKR